VKCGVSVPAQGSVQQCTGRIRSYLVSAATQGRRPGCRQHDRDRSRFL